MSARVVEREVEVAVPPHEWRYRHDTCAASEILARAEADAAWQAAVEGLAAGRKAREKHFRKPARVEAMRGWPDGRSGRPLPRW